MIKIEFLTKPTTRDLKDINRLVPQIAEKPHLLSMKELKQVTDQKESCRIIVARDSKTGEIAGMCALTLVRVMTGLLAMVEDVVVDNNYRGMGIGQMLTQKMIDVARTKRVKHISLTTNPAREAANAMYKKMGFFLKETNYYRINLFLPRPNLKKPKSSG